MGRLPSSWLLTVLIRCGNDSGESVYDSRGVLVFLSKLLELLDLSHNKKLPDKF